MKLLVRLAVGLAVGLAVFLAAGAALAESRLPDNDDTQFNNTPARAETIDVLRLDAAGRPQGIQVAGNLGVVLGKFDTADWYKFRIPPGKWKLSFLLNETPMTTMAIYLYRDPNADPIEKGRGHDFERFDYEFTSGDYYIQVFTTTGAAKGQLLRYSLSVTPALIPLPDTAGPTCGSARDLGKVGKSARIQGSLSPSKPVDAYQFYLEGHAEASVSRYNAWLNNTVSLIARNGDDRFQLADPATPGSKMYWIDPGFYCLRIELPAGIDTQNYDMELIAVASNALPLNPPPGGSLVTQYDLGNLSQNGRYRDRRYVNDWNAVGPELRPSTEHTIREWISAAQREHWYRFDVARRGQLKVGLHRLLNAVGAEVRDASGAVIATGQASGTPLDRYLPSTRLSADLEPGTYHIRLSYLSSRGPGTNYSMTVFFVEQ